MAGRGAEVILGDTGGPAMLGVGAMPWGFHGAPSAARHWRDQSRSRNMMPGWTGVEVSLGMDCSTHEITIEDYAFSQL